MSITWRRFSSRRWRRSRCDAGRRGFRPDGSRHSQIDTGALDAFSQGQSAKLKIDVRDAGRDDEYSIVFDPNSYTGNQTRLLKRPRFLPIISSATLGTMLVRRSNGRVDGFVVEGPSAGGHNAPPRGPLQLTSEGEPIYTARDDADLATIAALGLPFWVAGSYAEPHRVVEALAAARPASKSARPSPTAMNPTCIRIVKQAVLRASCVEGVRVYTDPVASPTGFRSRWSSSNRRSPTPPCTNSGGGSAIWPICGMPISSPTVSWGGDAQPNRSRTM